MKNFRRDLAITSLDKQLLPVPKDEWKTGLTVFVNDIGETQLNWKGDPVDMFYGGIGLKLIQLPGPVGEVFYTWEEHGYARKLAQKSASTLKDKIDFLRNEGFTDDEITKLISE